MPKDTELDRLKAAQDLAYNRKTNANAALQMAWDRKKAAKEDHDRAYETKDRAYQVQQAAWDDYQSLQNALGPRVSSLKSLNETAHQNMMRAFDNASSAHAMRDGAGAKRYAEEGHAFKAERNRYTDERRGLVDRLMAAQARHAVTTGPFQSAQAVFLTAKRTFDAAKADHATKQADYLRLREEFDAATAAFRARLEVVRAQQRDRQTERRSIAQRAGVPYAYLDNVWVSKGARGVMNIYFGGAGKPDGPGHGHYVMDAGGAVTYKRDPYEAHGSQNYVSDGRSYEEIVYGELRSGEFGFTCKFRGYDALVESESPAKGRRKINIYYGPNGPLGPGHHHAVAYRDTPLDFVYDRV